MEGAVSDAVRTILLLIDQLPDDDMDTLVRELLSSGSAHLGINVRRILDLKTVSILMEDLEAEVDAAERKCKELGERVEDLEDRTAPDTNEDLEDALEDADDNLADAECDLSSKERLLAAAKAREQIIGKVAKENQALIQEAVEKAETKKGRKAKAATKAQLTRILQLLSQGCSFPEIGAKCGKKSARWAEERLHSYQLGPTAEKLRNNNHY
jgi:hypothetical protein